MQDERHPRVAVGEHQKREEVLQEDGEDADCLLSGLGRPLRVDGAISLVSDLCRWCHVRHVVSRPDDPHDHESNRHLEQGYRRQQLRLRCRHLAIGELEETQLRL